MLFTGKASTLYVSKTVVRLRYVDDVIPVVCLTRFETSEPPAGRSEDGGKVDDNDNHDLRTVVSRREIKKGRQMNQKPGRLDGPKGGGNYRS